MSDESPSREVQEVELVQTERASFEGSGYDAGLSLDTTPTSRVDWAADRQLEGRSAYDAKMVVDTTPTARLEPITPPSSGSAVVAADSSDE
jgi:hypothetical protein